MTEQVVGRARARGAAALARGAAALASAALVAGCASGPPRPSAEFAAPVVFVHGNGDSAALWTTTMWRFESNGWPRDRMHAVNVPYPLARDRNSVPQPARTSAQENRDHLSREVDGVLARTSLEEMWRPVADVESAFQTTAFEPLVPMPPVG